MNDNSELIEITVFDPEGKSINVAINDQKAEILLTSLMRIISNRDPNREKSICNRKPIYEANYPGFMINTTSMNEVVINFASDGMRPISFTLSQDAVKNFRDGLNEMIDRLSNRPSITKQ